MGQYQQIFSNLIGNAVKYNHQGKNKGEVKIDYSSSLEYHEFIVTDNGPGIPENMQSHVFELFAKGRHQNGVDSTGIGLSIVKKLVGQNGGTISLNSAEGSGSTFKFTWPKIS